MKRRTLIKSSTIIGSTIIASGLYTWQIEPFNLEFVTKSSRIPNLPDSLEGKTLMQISDIHISNRFPINYIIKSLEKAKRKEPDFVMYTGDYITYDSDKQIQDLKNTIKHFPKGKLATVGILGNHDYGKNWADNNIANKITAELKTYGIEVLRNEQKLINNLNFIGLDDYWGRNFNPSLVMKNLDNTLPNILMSHNPDTADLDIWNNYQGWIFSGHTHGGQCKPPFLNPPMLPVKNKRYSSGLFDLNDGRKMYINRALGHLWQVRFNVRPEITIFKLLT